MEINFHWVSKYIELFEDYKKKLMINGKMINELLTELKNCMALFQKDQLIIKDCRNA